MSSKARTTVGEYLYLIERIRKLKELVKAAKGPHIRRRIKRRIRKFRQRMRIISQIHEDEGLPHPEYFTEESKEKQRKYEESLRSGVSPTQTRSVITPDGSLAKTPIMKGATLNPFYYPEDKIQEFLDNPEE